MLRIQEVNEAMATVTAKKASLVTELQKEILLLQGFRPLNSTAMDFGLGPIAAAFPNASFPLGAVHEFLSSAPEDAAATSGFIAGLLTPLMQRGGTSLWVSASRTLFPPALKNFGIAPDRFIFIDVKKENDVMWAIDEALKCGALAAVVGEVQALSFTASRRLQLAVEQSQVTGFILRHGSANINTTACVSRWKITQLASEPVDGLPGVGYPQWKVELLRVRNGKPGVWNIVWEHGRFRPLHSFAPVLHLQKKKAG